jgi:hypothetical protein
VTVTRQDIATALTAGGVTGVAYRPDVITPGMGWPEWREKAPLNMHPDTAYDVQWYAFVALTPGTQAATAAEADAIGEVVCRALQAAQLRVERFRWVRLQVSANPGDNSVPALEYALQTT